MHVLCLCSPLWQVPKSHSLPFIMCNGIKHLFRVMFYSGGKKAISVNSRHLINGWHFPCWPQALCPELGPAGHAGIKPPWSGALPSPDLVLEGSTAWFWKSNCSGVVLGFSWSLLWWHELSNEEYVTFLGVYRSSCLTNLPFSSWELSSSSKRAVCENEHLQVEPMQISSRAYFQQPFATENQPKPEI